MPDLIHAAAQIPTPNAQKYLTQLCKHFGHKVPARIEGDQGVINFSIGEAQLTATADALMAALSAATAKDLTQLQAIIDDHLKRFAFREGITGFDWPNSPPG